VSMPVASMRVVSCIVLASFAPIGFGVAGGIVSSVGVLHVLFPTRIYEIYKRMNRNKSPVAQDMRGWSPSMVRSAGYFQMILGVLFMINAARS
jgi:hypothetical protein